MSGTTQPQAFFIGWDVGGWNCDRNRESRDALVILDAERHLVGRAWRGNLRKAINTATNSQTWLRILFDYCETELPADSPVVLAIDTPLGFSDAFLRLISRLEYTQPIEASDSNPYLFRATEQFLFDHGLRPLSPVKDMIGSQATKGMHVLAKFAPYIRQCGVWGDGGNLTVIEAYPSACKASTFIQQQLRHYVQAECDDPPRRRWLESLDHQDKVDALTCALLAHAFSLQPNQLASPSDGISATEGWIWVPKEGLNTAFARLLLID